MVTNKRIRFLFSGIVQGVGFRPFIYRMAVERSLAGFVQNTPEGVVVEVEGPAAEVEQFLPSVLNQLPLPADVSNISSIAVPVLGETTFRIVASVTNGRKDVLVTPDMAICEDCLRELFDPENRRYRYPFINCTNCGPRLTIIQEVPYDRVNTSMACFKMCPRCQEEYEAPSDRRFHAEPNACSICGPFLWLTGENGTPLRGSSADPVQKAIDLILGGHILAVKGLGGFHLAVDATNEDAVRGLRARKFREEKPLAIMVKDIETASRIAWIDEGERKELLSPQRPIVLVRKKEKNGVAPSVAPGVPNQGIMLPYTPLHHLLMEGPFHALVMTSGNQVDEPICVKNREALSRLKGIADYFLLHNRDILVRCDDSVGAVYGGRPILFRRSRGYAPKPLVLKKVYPEVLALGPQLKATLCILKGSLAYLSPHIGDLETPQARDFYRESLGLMEKIAECCPKIIACDLHPAYYTTLLAEKIETSEVVRVQHHHAHIVSAMAENGLDGEVIGLAMDGTGYGLDGTVWGGEFLIADEAGFKRAGHIKQYLLPGGEKAIKEPWRTASSLLRLSYGEDWRKYAERLKIFPQKSLMELVDNMMVHQFNSPITSSLGRIFDGAASLLGIRQVVSFEGQAAMELEAVANEQKRTAYPFDIGEEGEPLILDLTPMIRAIVEERLKKRTPEKISSGLHHTLPVAFCSMIEKIRRKTGLNRVVLSGGCFQNRILLEGTIRVLKKAGFEIFFHQRLPTNDGCISLGQAVIAGAQAGSRA